MTEPEDNKPEEDRTLGRPTIREVMASVRLAQDEEWKREAEAARKARRDRNNQRAAARREKYQKEARRLQARRERDLQESVQRVSQRVATARTALRAALRDAQAVNFPRHTDQGREQVRMQRSIESALGALRRIGRGTFHVSDVMEDVGA